MKKTQDNSFLGLPLYETQKNYLLGLLLFSAPSSILMFGSYAVLVIYRSINHITGGPADIGIAILLIPFLYFVVVPSAIMNVLYNFYCLRKPHLPTWIKIISFFALLIFSALALFIIIPIAIPIIKLLFTVIPFFPVIFLVALVAITLIIASHA